MTISHRLGLRYAFMSAMCLLVLAWFGYHEFVKEPAAFAERGVSDLRKDMSAELATVVFLGSVPILLGIGWWWMRRVLAPLGVLTHAVSKSSPTACGKHCRAAGTTMRWIDSAWSLNP